MKTKEQLEIEFDIIDKGLRELDKEIEKEMQIRSWRKMESKINQIALELDIHKQRIKNQFNKMLDLRFEELEKELEKIYEGGEKRKNGNV